MAWIRTTNLRQNGTPVTRRIRIPDMSEAIWFTDQGYAEVSDSVATLLANNIESIETVPEPGAPGSYYGTIEGQQDVTVVFPREDRYIDDLDANTVRSAEVMAEESTITSLTNRNLLRSRINSRRRWFAGESFSPVTQFADLSGWTASKGSVAEYAGDSPFTHSASITLDENGDSDLEYTFPTPQDLTNKHPSIAFQYPDGTAGAFALDILFEDGSGNVVRFRRSHETVKQGLGWVQMAFGPYVASATSPDMSSITNVTVQLRGVANGEVRASNLRFLDAGPPRVLFRFDDGDDTQASFRETLDKYGYEGSFMVVPEFLDTSGYLTWDQLDEWYSQGHDVCCHLPNYDGILDIPTDQMRDNLVGARRELNDHGMHDGGRVYSYPGGNADTAMRDLVDSIFDIGTETQPEPRRAVMPVEQPDLMTIPSGRLTGNQSSFNQAVDLASEFGGVVGAYLHTTTEMDQATFDSVVSYANDAGLESYSFDKWRRDAASS